VARRRAVLAWMGIGALGLLGLGFFHFWTPVGGASTSICLFRRTLGLPCPGCGMTRAFAHLAKGEWRQAAADHPFSFVFAAEAGAAWLYFGAALLRGRVPRSPHQDVLERAVVGHLLVLLFFWIGRLATGTLPW
jgi:hypothetical protein